MNIRIFFLLTMALVVLGTWSRTDAHERAHAAVCKYLKGNASITQWADFNGIHGRTQCFDIDPALRNQYEALNALVETSGYKEQALWANIVLLQIALAWYVTREGKK